MDETQHLTITIDQQLLGIPVLRVHDVLGPQRITRAPLTSPVILGSLNLRGRIVTALDLRRRLGLKDASAAASQANLGMCVVVEHGGELYSLAVDSVGEVLTVSNADLSAAPAAIDQAWRNVAIGVHQMPGRLLTVIDVDALISSLADAAAPERRKN